jgi:hypothetical protein
VTAPQISPLPAALEVRETRLAALAPSAKDKSLTEKAPAAPPPDMVKPDLEPGKVTPVKAVLSSSPEVDQPGPWHAQLGRARHANIARADLKKALARNPDALALPSGVMAQTVRGRILYRAWLGSYESAAEARLLCKALETMVVGRCAIFKGATMEARND